MNAKNLIPLLLFVFCLAPIAQAEVTLSAIEKLGKQLFFDVSLSNPPGQSCASCHAAEVGWGGPDSTINAAGAVEPGVVFIRSGNRKPPPSAYAGFNPILHKCGEPGSNCMGGGGMGGGGMGMMDVFAGGLFWDGRATGWILGDPLAEQAMGPFLNPLEMNNPDKRLVCLNIQRTANAVLFEEVWGPGSLDCVKDVEATYERIASSIAAYERSAEVNPFSSKFDSFWREVEARRSVPRSGIPPVQNINMMNMVRFKDLGLTDMELNGLMIFNTKGKCSTCHFLQPMNGSVYPLFTDFRYHNLGLPKNPLNPFYGMPKKWNPDGENWIDPGLGGFLAKTAGLTDVDGVSRDYTADTAANFGKHKTPSLRNVDKRPYAEFVKAYGHNGYFKSLQEIIHFYNLRDVLPECTVPDPPKDMMGAATCFPPPEVAENINAIDMGNLGLTPQEGMALILFMKTLSDSD